MNPQNGKNSATPRIVISYARADGESLVREIAAMLAAGNLSYTFDYMGLEGGINWWVQFKALMDNAEHLVIVLTPGALASENVKKEWEYARAHQPQVSAVRGASDLDESALPRWMQLEHQYNLNVPEQRNRFLRVLEGPPKIWRTPFMASFSDSSGFIERTLRLGEIKHALLKPGDSALANNVVLWGPAGFGKTALAARICRDREIRDLFYDGILWVTLGEAPINPVEQLADLIEEIKGPRPGFTSIDAARAAFVKALDDRHCLLILDDAWHREDIEAFLPAGSRDATTRLVTTRDALASPENSCLLRINEMDKGEALALLTIGISSVDKDPLTSRLSDFAEKQLGGWPQPLKLANGFLRRRVSLGQRLEQAVDDLEEALKVRGASTALRRTEGVEGRRSTLGGTIGLSLNQLSASEQQRCKELAVFAPAAAVTLESVARLWSETAWETRVTCQRLYDLSLLQDLNLATNRLRIHETVQGVLGELLGIEALERLHHLFALSWLTDYSPDWRGLRDDYALRHLPWHLACARLRDALEELLLDPRWAEAKLKGLNVQALLADFQSQEAKQSPALRLVGRVIDLAGDALAIAPNELPSQLLGRLSPEDAPGLNKVLKLAIGMLHADSLIPLNLSLAPPGEELRRLVVHKGAVTCVAARGDSEVISGCDDGSVHLWNLRTGKHLRRVTKNGRPIKCIAILPNEIVLCGSDGLYAWDLASDHIGLYVKHRRSTTHWITALTVLPDNLFVSADDSGAISVWDSKNRKRLFRLTGHMLHVTSVNRLPDGRLVSTGWDGTLRIWDLILRKELQTGEALKKRFSGARAWNTYLAVLADGRVVEPGTAHTGGCPLFWNPINGQAEYVPGVNTGADTCLAALNGVVVFGRTDGTLRLYDPACRMDLRRIVAHGGQVNCIAKLAGGQFVSGGEDGALRVWDLAGPPDRRPPRRHEGGILSIAVVSDRQLVSERMDGTLDVWELRFGGPPNHLPGQLTGQTRDIPSGGYPWSPGLALLPGQRCVSAFGGDLILWDLHKTQDNELCRWFAHEPNNHNEGVTCILALPGERLVSGGMDGVLRLWDLGLWQSQGVRYQTISEKYGLVTCMAILPDGRLITGGFRGILRFWEPGVVSPFREFVHHDAINGMVRCVAAGADSSLVAGGTDGDLIVWDLERMVELRRLTGHEGWITGLSVLPGGRLVSGGRDGTVRLWDLSKGSCLTVLHLDAGVTALAGVDSHRVCVGDTLGQLHLIGVGSNQSIRYAQH
jgi:WD40 repeat protein